MRILIVFVFLIAGCATTPPINYAKMAGSLSLGMAKNDVIRTLGQPSRASMRVNGGGAIEELYYWSPVIVGYRSINNEHLANDKVVVILKDGRVSEWGDPNSIDRIMDRSLDMHKQLIESVSSKKLSD